MPFVEFYGILSAITETTVTVTLKNTPATEVTATNLSVTLDGKAINVSKVEKVSDKVYKLTIDSLKNKEGNLRINGLDTAFDFKAPEVKSVKPLSDRIIEIKFSENVNEALAQLISNYSLVEAGTANTVNMTGASIKVTGKDTVRLTLANALTKDTKYTLTVKGMQDVSINKNTMSAAGSSVIFTAIEDTVKPVIVSAVAIDANKIEVTMSKELTSTSVTATVKAVKEDGTLDTAKTNTAVVDGNKVVITLSKTSEYLEDGKVYDVALTGGADLSGNVIADNQAIKVTGVRDVVAPTVVETPIYDAENKTITINFSEEMANLDTESNYALFETETGLTHAISSVTVSEDKKSVKLNLSSALKGETLYSIRLNGLKDTAIIANTIAANTIVKFTTNAVITPVELSSAEKPVGDKEDGKTVVLTFNQDLIKEEAENVKNYSIVEKDDAKTALQVTKAVYNSSDRTVTLTTAAQKDKQYTVKVANLLNLDSSKAEKDFTGVDKVKAVLNNVTPKTKNVIDLEFSKEMSAAGTITIVEKGTANAVSVSTSQILTNKKVVRVTTATELKEGSEYTITVAGAKDNSISTNTVDTVSKNFAAVEDKTAPVINAVTCKNGASIEIELSEELKEVGTLDKNNFEIKKGDKVVELNDDVEITVSGSKITLTNKESSNAVAIFENGETYTVALKETTSNYITDLAGNKASNAAVSFKGVVDTIKPAMTGAAMGERDNEVILTFSEEIQALALGQESKFVVTDAVTGESVSVTNAESLTGDDSNKIKLTLAKSTIAGKQYRVYISDASIIKDLEVTPNTLDMNSAVALFTGKDLTAPDKDNVTAVLKSAETIVLTFNEKLDANSVSKEDFVVTNGSNITVKKATVGANDAANTVTLIIEGNEDTSFQPEISIAAKQSIADLSGNKLGGDLATVLTITSRTDKAAPVLKSAVKSGSNDKVIELTFSENIETISSSDSDTIAKVLSIPGYTIESITATGSDNKVTVTLSESVTTNPSVILKAGQTLIKDAANNIYAGNDSVIAE